MSEQLQYDGWALVEILGHRKVAGMVTTHYFGATGFFKVVTPEVPETLLTLESPAWLEDGTRALKGAVLKMSRPASEIFIGVASVYAFTPIREEDVLSYAPVKQELFLQGEQPLIEAPLGGAVPTEDDGMPFYPP